MKLKSCHRNGDPGVGVAGGKSFVSKRAEREGGGLVTAGSVFAPGQKHL